MLGKRPDPATFAGQHWDLIVVGGGITGAGILLEAALVVARYCCWSNRILPGARRVVLQKWYTAVCAISAWATFG